MIYEDCLGVGSLELPTGWIYRRDYSTVDIAYFDYWGDAQCGLLVNVAPAPVADEATAEDWLNKWASVFEIPDADGARILPLRGANVAEWAVTDLDGREQRWCVFRCGPFDVAVLAFEPSQVGELSIAKALRVIRASFGAPDETHTPKELRDLRGLCRHETLMDGYPKVSTILAMAEIQKQLALDRVSPDLMERAENCLCAIRNSLSAGNRHADHIALVDQQLQALLASYADLAQIVGSSNRSPNVQMPAEMRPTTGAESSVLRGDLLLTLAEADDSIDRVMAADRVRKALECYLEGSLAAPSLLDALGRADKGLPVPGVHLNEWDKELARRIAYAASVSGDMYARIPEGSPGHEMDEIAIATLQIIREDDPAAVIDGQPIEQLLHDRLVLAAVHLYGKHDESSKAERESLLAEAEAYSGSSDGVAARSRARLIQGLIDAVRASRTDEADQLAEDVLRLDRDLEPQMLEDFVAKAQVFTMLRRVQDAREAVAEGWKLLQAAIEQNTGFSLREAIRLSNSMRLLGLESEALEVLMAVLTRTSADHPRMQDTMHTLVTGSLLFERIEPELAARAAAASAMVMDYLRLNTSLGEWRIRHADEPIHEDITGNAVRLTLAVGAMYEALSISDRSRARSLFDTVVVAERSVRSDRGAKATADSSPEPPSSSASSVSRRLDKLAAAALKKVSDAFELAHAAQPLSSSQLAQLVSSAEENILVPHPMGDRILLFVVSKGVLHFRESMHGPEHLALLSTELRSRMHIHSVSRGVEDRGGFDDGPARPLLEELYDVLVGPVVGLLAPDRPLIIVPYRELGVLPWAMLVSPDGTMLVEEFPISIAPSLSVWRALGNRRATTPDSVRAYVAADPVLDARRRARGLGSLPGAAEDAKFLETLLTTRGDKHGRHSVHLFGAATQTSYRLEAPMANLIHLACHAELGDSADTCRIHLAADAEHDGVLTAARVREINLSDATAFLAACDTGLGRISFDGTLGLGQAFLAAGAQTVIVSLWKASDAATSTLTRHFYQAMLSESSPKHASVALRIAMLATRQDLIAGRVRESDGSPLSADPRLWGGFLLIGRGDASFSAVSRPPR